MSEVVERWLRVLLLVAACVLLAAAVVDAEWVRAVVWGLIVVLNAAVLLRHRRNATRGQDGSLRPS